MTVEADQLNKGLATSPADLLQGKTPGVQIMTNSGAPGAGSTIRIRGGSSLSASNDPLIVIDGLPISSTEISGGDVLNTINPNDIESFSILSTGGIIPHIKHSGPREELHQSNLPEGRGSISQ